MSKLRTENAILTLATVAGRFEPGLLAMELTLSDAEFYWTTKSQADAGALQLPELVTVSVMLLPTTDGDASDQELSLPCTLRVATPETGEESERSSVAVEQTVTFKVLSGKRPIASRVMKLRDCVPLLSEGTVSWTHDVVIDRAAVSLEIVVHVKTNRQPRELLHQALVVKQQASVLARQLSLHRNKVAVGLLPPVLSSLIGIAITSPIWLPLTLLVGVMGFPLWFVAALGASLVLVFASISTLVMMRLVRSARLKAAVDGFLRSPQGQLLLFQGSPASERLSPVEMAAKLQQYVMESPSRKLLASLAIDFLGTATFAVPVVGELADVLWAPVSAKLVSDLYSESSPHAKYLAFMEELLPFTDIIPTATLAWMKENLSSGELRELMQSTLGTTASTA